MRKSYFFLLPFLGISFLLHAQENYRIEGTVKDTLNFLFTQYTSVSLLRASDSVLITFTRANTIGHFSLSADSPGLYLMLFENPQFASLVKKVTVTKLVTDLGIIPLISRKHLLKEVVISGKNTITIKGDTIEYAADSFKTGKYDDVDALLRQLPGLEVGPDGSIKAYGKKVQKMLVDGEEFFNDDPAIVAKMLRASMIKTVQVFDKKSGQAQLTGIDDGLKIKTINLLLKDNAKDGYFGKVSAGGGLPGFWQNEAMINNFQKKSKMAAYAIMSNTQTGGLGFGDALSFSGSPSNLNFSNGSAIVASSDGAYNGTSGSYQGQGLPKTWNGGVHYNNSWWGDTLKINGSYNFYKNSNASVNNTVTQYILPDTQYLNSSHAESYNSQINHSLNFNGDYKIDSLSGLNVRINGTMGISSSRTFNESQMQSLTGAMINDNQQTQTNSGTNQNINAYLTYRKRFRKKGRSFSASLSGTWNHSNSNGLLQSDYHLFAIDSTKIINQKKVNQNQNQSAGLGLNYTEPVAKDLYLLFNYHLNLNNQESQIQSLNPENGSSSNYEVLDSVYSSHYVYRILDNRGGIQLQYNPGKKFRMTAGGDISSTDYTQHDLMANSAIRYSYFNFFPSVSLSFQKSEQTSFNLYYNGRSQQPSMSQIQPVRNNDDPLNVIIGNPNLKQSFSHSFHFQYYNFKALTNQNISLNASFSFDQNAITQDQNIDLSGRRTYQYVNVNGNYTAGFWANYGRQIIGHFSGNSSANISYNRTHNFINNLKNLNNTWVFAPNLRLSYNLDTTLQIDYTFNPNYNSTVSNIRSDIKTRYWNFQQVLNAWFRLPFGFKVGTNIEWDFRQQLSNADKNNKVLLWNAWLKRSFLKNRSLVLKIYANDILNQNIGYDRIATAEQISESNYNTIQRYFMLSLTWNFTKTFEKQNN